MDMSSVREILSAIERLTAEEFAKLQAQMNRIAERIWQKEHERLSRKFRQEGLTDDDVDRLVLRRRHRGRAR
jgi:hypothetical protein